MNRVAKQLIRMFNFGEAGSKSNSDRINKAAILKETNPPPISFLWKTHKEYTDLPPTRPLCDARNGPLARTSEILTMVLSPILASLEVQETCDSTENIHIQWQNLQTNFRRSNR